ncbi:MAG: ABC transporter permease, partial [Sarcina sp.]
DEYVKSKEFKENLAKDLKDNNVYEFKVKNIIDDDIFSRYYNENLGIIFNENFYNNAIDTAKNSGHSREVRIDFNTENEQELKKVSSQIEKVAEDNEVTYINKYEENKREEQMWLVINVFIYGFIVLITLIGIINVLTTIMLNILLKKKEFGTLETIGMSKKQLTKMIMLEGLLHGVIASVIGGIVSIALVKLMIIQISKGFTITDKIPITPFIIGFGGVLIITLISSLLPLRKLKNISAVDCIRNNE